MTKRKHPQSPRCPHGDETMRAAGNGYRAYYYTCSEHGTYRREGEGYPLIFVYGPEGGAA